MRLGVLQVDGLDATDVILALVSKTRTHVIFLSGASFAGFNLVNSRRLCRTLHVPVIIVSRDKPDNYSVRCALKKHFPDWKTRWEMVRGLGPVHAFAPKASERPLYFESVGVSCAKAKRIIESYCITSRVPEPIRVAAITAKGLALAARELATCRHEIRNAKFQGLKVHDRK